MSPIEILMSLTGCVPGLLPEKWGNYYFLDFIVCFEFRGQKYCSQHHSYMLISYLQNAFL